MAHRIRGFVVNASEEVVYELRCCRIHQGQGSGRTLALILLLGTAVTLLCQHSRRIGEDLFVLSQVSWSSVLVFCMHIGFSLDRQHKGRHDERLTTQEND